MKYGMIVYESIVLIATFFVIKECLLPMKRWEPPEIPNELLPDTLVPIPGDPNNPDAPTTRVPTPEERYDRERMRVEFLKYAQKRSVYEYRLMFGIVIAFSFFIVWQLLYRWTNGASWLGLDEPVTYFELVSSLLSQVLNVFCVGILVILGFKSFIKGRKQVGKKENNTKKLIFITTYIVILIPHLGTYWGALSENLTRFEAVSDYGNFSDSIIRKDAETKLKEELAKKKPSVPKDTTKVSDESQQIIRSKEFKDGR